MARVARVEAFAPDEIATIHVMNRVVRRCFLMGTDELTGKNYDHRKAWFEKELKRLAAGFGIHLLNFAILSNHFHSIGVRWMPRSPRADVAGESMLRKRGRPRKILALNQASTSECSCVSKSSDEIMRIVQFMLN